MMIHDLLPPAMHNRTPPRRDVVAFSLSLFLASIPPGTRAADIRWDCWESAQDNSVSCRLDKSGVVPVGLADERDDAEFRRLSATLPANMPPVARQLRLDPMQFIGREIKIPLLGPSDDLQGMQELAQAVMCGSRGACTVSFSAKRPNAARRDSVVDRDPAPD